MNSTQIQQEIDTLKSELSELKETLEKPVLSAAQAIEQAKTTVKNEARKAVLCTAITQFQSQLEVALREEAMERRSAAISEVDKCDREGIEKLRAMAQKFEEVRSLYEEFVLWEARTRKVCVPALSAVLQPEESVGDLGFSAGGNLQLWGEYKFETLFFRDIQLRSFLGRARRAKGIDSCVTFLKN
jgi:ribosomal protein S20